MMNDLVSESEGIYVLDNTPNVIGKALVGWRKSNILPNQPPVDLR